MVITMQLGVQLQSIGGAVSDYLDHHANDHSNSHVNNGGRSSERYPSMVQPTPQLMPNHDNYALLTDLYQLTMGACYDHQGIADKPAAFELFVRRLPERFSYGVVMGLAMALEYLENLYFSPELIAKIQGLGVFRQAPASFWQRLAGASGKTWFTGNVWAMPEGTLFSANEPLLRIEAPLWQAQLVETYLLNTLNYQSLIATKAARLRDQAGDHVTLLEFGTRRAFAPQGALWAARAALASGFDATSNVWAALQLGREPSGTMAHALVMALTAQGESELTAFEAFHELFPHSPLLIDTFDPVRAMQTLGASTIGATVAGIRIDSGDVLALAHESRRYLPQARVFVSGDIDEAEIARLKSANAPIDGYGVGTKLVTGTPVNGVYKLVELDGQPVVKHAAGKSTYAGKKQVFRHIDATGMITGDRLGLMTEPPLEGEQPLLELVMTNGKRQKDDDSLEVIAQRVRQSVQALPSQYRNLDPDLDRNLDRNLEHVNILPVAVSDGVLALTAQALGRQIG
jgi:nicotinate phosphoribosyltransferase